MIPVKAEFGKFLFSLSPNDLVYIRSEEEMYFDKLTLNQVVNIYKVVSFTSNQCFFVHHQIASSIVNKVEFSVLNKMEKNINGVMIKESCIKLKVDRLGNIKPA